MGRDMDTGMPIVGAGRLRERPSFTIGRVRKTRVIRGRVYADVDDLWYPQIYVRCPVLAFGGGEDQYAFFPITEDTDVDPISEPFSTDRDRQVMLLHRGGHSVPYVIGAVQPYNMGIKDAPAPDVNDSDHGADVSKKDIAFRNNGALLLIDGNGAITLVAGDADYIRIQLPSLNGRLRVSRDGEADEKVILADAFLDNWVNTELYNTLLALNERVRDLESKLATTISAVTSIPVSTGGTAQPLGLPSAPTPTDTTPPKADDSHKSGTIQLSERSLAEEGV